MVFNLSLIALMNPLLSIRNCQGNLFKSKIKFVGQICFPFFKLYIFFMMMRAGVNLRRPFQYVDIESPVKTRLRSCH